MFLNWGPARYITQAYIQGGFPSTKNQVVKVQKGEVEIYISGSFSRKARILGLISHIDYTATGFHKPWDCSLHFYVRDGNTELKDAYT